jgi:hypothetical protein
MVLKSALDKIIKDFNNEIDEVITQIGEVKSGRYVRLAEISRKVPKDPQLFYEDFGLFIHPLTQEPVKQLAFYQQEFIKLIDQYKYAAAIKSNRIGLSSAILDLSLFPHMITDCAGYQALIMGQNQRLSREHLYSLHKDVLNSEKYADFIIGIGDRDINLLRGESSRITELFIRNPFNPKKPSRIIALPPVLSNAVSWKEVKYIMCSDIAVAPRDPSPVIKALYTRLAMTQGYYVIETIPNGPTGEIYDLWLRNKAHGSKDFQVKEYPIGYAIQAGVVTKEFIEDEKERQGIDFARLYECSFAATGGNVFNLYDVDRCVVNTDVYDPWNPAFIHDINYPKSMGIDIGHRVSQAGIVILQMRNGYIEVLDAMQTKDHPNAWVVDYAYDQMMRFNIENAFVDSAASPFISDFKDRINETAYVMMTDIVNTPTTSERIVPVPFHPLNKPMLIHANNMVSNGYLRIHESFKDLINQMKMATHFDGKLIKNKGNDLTLDLLDALFMALLRYGFELEREK